MRPWIIPFLLLATCGGPAAPAAEKPTRGAKPSTSSPTPTPPSPAADADADADDREAVALSFVRENHPELASLLEQLKAMKPEQYQRAIAELWQVTRTLANMKKNDERRYELALEAWKARSRAELLAAQVVTAPDPALEGQLRAAVEHQVDVEIRQQRHERDVVEARLRKLEETIGRAESRRDALVESRYQSLLKKGQRARRLEAGQAAPGRPSRVKGED